VTVWPTPGPTILAAAAGACLALAPRIAEAKTRIFPLPMFTTNPNEGNTYGAMPVFVGVDGEEGRIRSITAPSLSWNRSAGVTGTFRFYRYRQLFVSWFLIVSASTQINRSLWFQYDDNRRERGVQTKNVLVRARRNLFYRFFGFGPDTPPENESSYTRLFAIASLRWGWNLTEDLNVAAYLEVRGDRPERHTISGLPPTQDLFPNAPGLDGSALARQGLSARFDTRDRGDYSERGFSSELSATLAEGITGAGVFGELISNTRLLVPETSFLQLAARLYWRQLIGDADRIPFYDQASLGGELLLRGFPTDRFVDKGAWEAEVEQRIRLFQTHIFGVVADWRIDPFVAAGQVYGEAAPWSRVRVATGVGLRMWVKPDIVGRIDVAYAGEGIRAYVMLGYPY
jgi:hypothetical protein